MHRIDELAEDFRKQGSTVKVDGDYLLVHETWVGFPREGNAESVVMHVFLNENLYLDKCFDARSLPLTNPSRVDVFGHAGEMVRRSKKKISP